MDGIFVRVDSDSQLSQNWRRPARQFRGHTQLMRLVSSELPEDDGSLMAAVAKKDRAAQEVLVRRLAGRVGRLTRALCGSQADAEDTSQVALVEILKSGATFRVESSIEHWADKITIRCVMRMLRRERRRRGLLRRWLSPDRLPWGVAAYVSGGERPGLDQVLELLPYERREALILRHAFEYSVEEIAELTSAPRGTVKDRLVNGRKQMRRLLERGGRAHQAFSKGQSAVMGGDRD